MTDTQQIGTPASIEEDVLKPLKSMFVGKDEIIDLLGVCLVSGENLFLLGPPGTAKSALIQQLAMRLDGQFFDYLLTRFTEPNELFGPFDIRRLREGELVTNFSGMLPEADFVFLDELLNANSAILNSLLMALNEKVFRRGRETVKIKSLMYVGASNHLPEDDALGALFDRFLVRVECNNVDSEQLGDVLNAGWLLQNNQVTGTTLACDQIRNMQLELPAIEVAMVRNSFVDVIKRLRNAGIDVSDRRAVKLQRLVAASALLCGRRECRETDLWVLRHIWNTIEQNEVIRPIVNEFIEKAEVDLAKDHPRSRSHQSPDPEQLSKQLAVVSELLDRDSQTHAVKDQLTLLSAQVQWVENAHKREQLEQQVKEIWKQAGND